MPDGPARRGPRDLIKRSVEGMPRSVKSGIKRAYYRRMLRKGTFTPSEPELGLARRWLRAGDGVLDVGAYVGQYTIPLARTVGERGRVMAVEPSLENFELLVANVAAAGCTNVTLLNVAASRDIRLVQVETPLWDDGTKAQSRTRVAERGEDAVLAYPLDRLVGEAMEGLRLVKVDVEGHERDVLDGMGELIRVARPVLIVEASGNHESPALASLGYRELRLAGSPNVVYATGDDWEAWRRWSG